MNKLNYKQVPISRFGLTFVRPPLPATEEDLKPITSIVACSGCNSLYRYFEPEVVPVKAWTSDFVMVAALPSELPKQANSGGRRLAEEFDAKTSLQTQGTTSCIKIRNTSKVRLSALCPSNLYFKMCACFLGEVAVLFTLKL